MKGERTANLVALHYRNGDLPFRPRYVSRLFALRYAMKSPINAVRVVEALPVGPTRQHFVRDLEAYADSPLRWVYHEVWMKRWVAPLPDLQGIAQS